MAGVTDAGLAEGTINAAFKVPAEGRSVGHALINGAVVIYDLEAPPDWLRPILQHRNDDGDVHAAFVEGDDGYSTVEFSPAP